MTKPIKTLLCVCLLCWQSLIISQNNIYVATNGDDSNDGSISSPYRTFAKAVSEMSAGDVCIIRGGTYEEKLTVSKNGTAGNYLTFRAADGEKVDIRATKKINGWQQHSGSIYKATVSMAIDSRFRAVYHNEDYMDLARWPNNTDNDRWTVDCHPVDGGGDGNHITASGIPDYNWENGGLLYYFGAHSGASWTRPITSSTTSRIDHSQVDITRWPFNIHNAEVWRNYPGNNRGQFFLFNILDALDYAREWYYEASTNTLYFQPANGTVPADGEVEYAADIYAAELKGDYIILDGLEFFGGSVKIHNNADNNQVLNCKVTHGSEGHDSLTNTSAQVGASAIEVLGDFTTVKGCTINHCSTSGILIAGWAADDCTIEGNYISNTDYVGIHASPIRSTGDNVKVLKNTIFNTGRDGMYVAGNNCEVAYNDVSASQKINSDSGVFYTVGNQNLRNNVIHHNWFHDATAPSYSHEVGKPAKAAGIYLDNDSKGFTVHHNVIWNVSWSGYQVNWNNTHLDFYHNTIWNAERAMDSWVNGRDQENNKVYNNYSNKGDWFEGDGPQEFDIQDNVIDASALLVDPENLNFMPKSDSPLIDAAQVITGFDKPFKGAAPDIGAYERLGTNWTAGVNAIEDTGEGNTISISDIQFTIAVSSETCPGQNNGILSITASTDADYQVTFNGQDYDFIENVEITDISPDSYDNVCIIIKGDTASQCFNVEVTAAAEITFKTSLKSKALDVVVTNGTAPYEVFVNDSKVLQTMASSFSVPVAQGDVVTVKSDKECEGELITAIDFYTNIQPFPNPTLGKFHISLPVDEGRIPVEIYDIRSQLISSKIYTVNSGNVDFDLTDKPAGIYFAKLVLEQENPFTFKIVKN
ncbi:hypothetical protein MHTCC0001_03690 [Flavobacteriaceae bacterium MHTCC 0001]